MEQFISYLSLHVVATGTVIFFLGLMLLVSGAIGSMVQLPMIQSCRRHRLALYKSWSGTLVQIGGSIMVIAFLMVLLITEYPI